MHKDIKRNDKQHHINSKSSLNTFIVQVVSEIKQHTVLTC